jgi:hypothetical protein
MQLVLPLFDFCELHYAIQWYCHNREVSNKIGANVKGLLPVDIL